MMPQVLKGVWFIWFSLWYATSETVFKTSAYHGTITHKCMFTNVVEITYITESSISSVQFSCSVISNSLQPHGLQHPRLPCSSPSPRACSNSCPLSQWCYPTISSSVVPFSSCLQSFPASGSFPRSQLFASGGQSIGASASASVLPMNIQDWFPLGWTGWTSLQSKGLKIFASTTVRKHQFSAQPSCPTLISIHDYWKYQFWLDGPLLAK